MTPNSGFKSSEFWLKLIAILVAAVLASGILPEQSSAVKLLTIALTILSALGYTAARTALKMKMCGANTAALPEVQK